MNLVIIELLTFRLVGIHYSSVYLYLIFLLTKMAEFTKKYNDFASLALSDTLAISHQQIIQLLNKLHQEALTAR